jgi:hypothetical protein
LKAPDGVQAERNEYQGSASGTWFRHIESDWAQSDRLEGGAATVPRIRFESSRESRLRGGRARLILVPDKD